MLLTWWQRTRWAGPYPQPYPQPYPYPYDYPYA